MNTPWNEQDERLRQLDLLVDGELNETQRRELLLALEREPEGWRSCALAFLEAQSWGSSMRRLATSDVAEPVEPSEPRAVAPVVSAHWNVRQVTTWLAMAASVVICFCLGLSANRWWGPSQPSRQQPFLAVNGTQQPAPVGRDLDQGSWELNSPAIPRQVVDVLERMGGRVKQERQFLPFPLNDGRKVIVPVDQIELTPANLRDFQ